MTPRFLRPVTNGVGGSFLGNNIFLYVVLLIWAGLAILAITKLTFALYRTRQLLKTASPVSARESFVPAGWPNEVAIAASDEITGPMTVGLMRSSVLLPNHLIVTLSTIQNSPYSCP